MNALRVTVEVLRPSFLVVTVVAETQASRRTGARSLTFMRIGSAGSTEPNLTAWEM